jgi:uncharacterized membrane protein YbhN (UPF0104 family)
MVKRLFSALLTVGILGGLGLWTWLHRDEVASLVLVWPAGLALCTAAQLACLLVVGPLFYVMINKLRRCVGLVECVALSILTNAVNTLVPLQGGAGVRAVYLKQRHGFDYSNFLATLYGYNVLRLLVCTLGGTGAVLWLVAGEHRAGLTPILTGAVLCLAVSVAACCLPRVPDRGGWLLARLAAFTEGWHTLRAQPAFLLLMTGLVALQLAAEVLTFWAACAALGVPLSAAEAVAIGTLSILVTVLGLTPGGLGLFEAMSAFVSCALALNPVASVMAVLASRVVLVGLLLAVTPLALYYLSKEWKPREPAKEPMVIGGPNLQASGRRPPVEQAASALS